MGEEKALGLAAEEQLKDLEAEPCILVQSDLGWVNGFGSRTPGPGHPFAGGYGKGGPGLGWSFEFGTELRPRLMPEAATQRS